MKVEFDRCKYRDKSEDKNMAGSSSSSISNITIVYDNENNKGFTNGWGFSCLIDTGETKILFDTGWDGCVLLHNLKNIHISPEEIDKVVLSHQHWDHIGGLPVLLKIHPGIEVYVPASFSKRLKDEISARANLIEVSEATKICHSVYTTGELDTDEKGMKEQSLIINSVSGLYIITGCSHPGLTRIINAASQFGTVTGIIGGLHGSTDYTMLEGMNLIAACHCTVHKKEIAMQFPDAFKEVGAGWGFFIPTN
ncbi:MAG: MBL fold metallo-hydrolase [Methanosarcinaceae archaeon]